MILKKINKSALFLFSLFLAVEGLNAQIFVQPGDVVTIPLPIRNKSDSAAIINNVKVQVTGDSQFVTNPTDSATESLDVRAVKIFTPQFIVGNNLNDGVYKATLKIVTPDVGIAPDPAAEEVSVGFKIDRTPPQVSVDLYGPVVGIMNVVNPPLNTQIPTITINDTTGGISTIDLIYYPPGSPGGVILAPKEYPIPATHYFQQMQLEEGNYMLVAQDAAGNITTVSFYVPPLNLALNVHLDESMLSVNETEIHKFTVEIKADVQANFGLRDVTIADDKGTPIVSQSITGAEASVSLSMPGDFSDYDFSTPQHKYYMYVCDQESHCKTKSFVLMRKRAESYADQIQVGQGMGSFVVLKTDSFQTPVIDLTGDGRLIGGGVMPLYIDPAKPDWWQDGASYHYASYGAALQTVQWGDREQVGHIKVTVRTWNNVDKSDMQERIVSDRETFIANSGEVPGAVCPGEEDGEVNNGYCYIEVSTQNIFVPVKRYVQTETTFRKTPRTTLLTPRGWEQLPMSSQVGYDLKPGAVIAGPQIYGFTMTLNPGEARGKPIPTGPLVDVPISDGADMRITNSRDGSILDAYPTPVSAPAGFSNPNGLGGWHLEVSEPNFDQASMKMPYDSSNVPSTKELRLQIFEKKANATFSALPTEVDTVNKKVSAVVGPVSDLVVAYPAYDNPVSVMSSIVIDGNPEMTFTSEDPTVTQSVYDTSSVGGQSLLSLITANGGVLASKVYQLGPENQVLKPYGAIAMRYSRAELAAAGIQESSLDIYGFSLDGSSVSVISNSLVNTASSEVLAEVRQLYPLFAIVGSTQVPSPEDITPPVSTLVSPVGYVAGNNTYIPQNGLFEITAADQNTAGAPVSNAASSYYLIDAEPGTVAPIIYTGPFTLPEGIHSIKYRSGDNAGNMEAWNTRTFYVDGNPPETQIAVVNSTAPMIGTVYITERDSITLTAIDPISSGVTSEIRNRYFLVDTTPETCQFVPEFTGPAGTCLNPKYSMPFMLSAGSHTVYYASDDNVGNMAVIKSANFSVAATPRAAGFAAPVPMLENRILHAETLLPDGRVLITGGRNGNVPLSSAELYDPVSKTFSATGSMNVPRTYHTSTLLPDGKVLIAVGRNSGGFLSSAELYDPATGIFTYTGTAKAVRAEHTATLLPNGKVLFAGGYANGASLSSAELYNPADGTFRAISPMSAARDNHTATLLPNGLVLLAGGTNASGTLSTAVLYNPATEAFSAAGQLSAPRGLQTAVLLPNGKVLLVGGLGAGYAYLSSAEVYDPGTNTFAATTGQMSTVRNQPVAALLPTGKVLVAGGHNSSIALSSTELYDPAAGTFSSGSSMSTGRDNHTATSLADGKVLIAGGAGTPSAEVYDPGFSVPVSIVLTSVAVLPSSATIGVGATQQFTATGNFSDGSSRALGASDGLVWSTDNSAVATVSPDGLATGVGDGTAHITVSSGIISAEASLVVGVIPPAAGFSLTGPMTAVRIIHTGTLLQDGRVLITGGNNGNGGGTLSSAELYDPGTKTFSATGLMHAARVRHTATLLPNGKVLIAGGGNLSSAELYDPSTGLFANTGSMNAAREDHTATLLPNGKVLIAGGYAGGSVLSSAELYDPANGTFTPINSMIVRRTNHTATLLTNGKVLLAGGHGNISSAELYDPVTGLFTNTGPMTAVRGYQAAALLPNGKVLLVGGLGAGYSYSASADLYDPVAGTFAATGSMSTVRHRHVAVSLPNGKVLVAGGNNSVESLSSVELYDPASGIFTATDSMSIGRSEHAGALLKDGKVLIAGGAGTPSAEVYDPGFSVPVSIALTSMAVLPSSATIGVGATQQFTATGNFSDGSSRALGTSDGLVWSTDNSAVATISTDGLAAGVANGTASITVSSGIISAEASLIVGAIAPAVPEAVSDLSARPGIGSDTAILSWTETGTNAPLWETLTGKLRVDYSLDPAHVFSAGNYQIEVPFSATAGAGPKYLLSGLTSESTYYIKVYLADGSGNVSEASNLAQVFVSNIGLIDTIAGDGTQSYGGDGGLAISAQIPGVVGLAKDPSGNLYLATDDWRVRKIDPAGIITTFAGTGEQGYGGDGGPAINAQFSDFGGIAADSSGNVYIADPDNNRIRKVDTAGIVTTFAGTGVQGFSGDGGPAINAQFNYPAGVYVDQAGNVYISDAYNGRVRKIDAAGVITTIGGTGEPGFGGDGGPATSAQLGNPFRVSGDSFGNIYVTDWDQFRIRKIGISGIITTVAGTGIQGYSGDGGPAADAQINYAFGMSVDAAGNLYFLDHYNYRVRKVDASGIITTVAGAGTEGYSGDGGPALSAQFSYFGGGLLVKDDKLYIGDYGNYRLRMVVLPPLSPENLPPSTPTGLAVGYADETSSDRLQINWLDNSDNEAGFRLERSENGIDFDLIAALPEGTTNYLDTTLITGTQYWYRVRAYSANGESGYSNTGDSYTRGLFVNIDAGLPGVEGASLSWGDYDNDGDLDLAIIGDTGSEKISKIYRNDAGIFVDINAGLPGVTVGAVSWGDFDNDGDLDLALAGENPSGVSWIYRNDNGVFTDINASLPGVDNGASISWGDYDNDGGLDLMLSGNTGSGPISRIYRNDTGVFTDINSSLPGGKFGAVSWGDYDNDGDLDLALAGDAGADFISGIYRNDNGVLSDISAGLPGVDGASVSWGDYDNDGDLDLVLTGRITDGSYTSISRIYRNDNGVFTDINAGLPGVMWGSVSWGDYDNDGDLDLALSGLDETQGSSKTSKIFRNDAGIFIDINAGLPGVYLGSLAWGDYDNDGNLDLALTGLGISRIYRNIGNIYNSYPIGPSSGFASNYLASSSTLVLSWGAGSDAQTPASGLCYEVLVSTVDMVANPDRGGPYVVSVTSGAGTGNSPNQTLGNYPHGFITAELQPGVILRNLQDNTSYYWKVRAIDTGLARSAWSGQQIAFVRDFTPPAIPTMTVEPETITQVSNYTTVVYELVEPGYVSLEVLSSTAPYSRLRSISNGLLQSAGSQSAQWNGRSDSDVLLGDGAYIIRLTVTDEMGNASVPLDRAVFIDYPPQIQSISARPANFNPTSGERTRFVFGVSEEVTLNITVKDVNGYPIKNLAEGSQSPAGSLSFYWDGRDNSAQPVQPGIYHIDVNAIDRTGNQSSASGGNCEVLSPQYPAITGLAEAPDPFYPGSLDPAVNKVVISYNLAAVSQTSTLFPVTVVIRHPVLGVVKTITFEQEQGNKTLEWDGLSDPGTVLDGQPAPDGAYSEEVSVNVDGQVTSAYGAFSLLRNNVYSAQSSGSAPTVTVQYDDPVAQISITQDPPQTSTFSAALLSQTLSGNVLASPIFDIVATQAFTTQPVLRFKYDPVFDGESLALYKYSILTGTWIQVSTSYYVDLANNEIIVTLNPDVFMGSLFALMKTSDTTPPVTGLALTGSQYTAGGKLYIGGQSKIGFTAQDSGGSGISYTEYRADDGVFAAYVAPFTMPVGSHVIEYRSADNDGNIEAVKTSSITVDNEAPVSTIAFSGAVTIGADGGFVVPAGSSVSFTAADMPAGAASGVSDIWYSVDSGTASVFAVAVELDRGSHTLAYWSIDNLGNTEAQKTALVSVGESAWMVKLNLEPSTLNLKSKGESVTAKLRFEGSGQACFKPKTLKISAINGLELNNPIFAQSSKAKDDDDSRCGSITVKFDRETLIAVLPPNAVSNITVSGALTDGRGFSASDTIKTIKPRKTTRKDGGRLENERRAGFDAPAGALRHDDDLYVLSVEGDYGSSESGKDAAAKARGIARRGIAYEFGPTGTIFDKPVTISLPCDADDRSSEKLAIAYWNEAAGLWELLPSRRDTAARLIKADVPHFSQYQVVLASYAVSSQETVRRVRASEQGELSVSAADAEFKLGEVYVYPNPAKGGKVPTFHVEVGIADIVKIRVYTVAGQLVHERSLAGTPQTIGSVYAYEYAWAGHIASGVYYYTIEAERTGKKLKSRGKFAVVR